MARILVIRFSALGDVAMTIPIVYSFARQHPEHTLYFVSRAGYGELFAQSPDNLHFVGIDLKKEYSGGWGLIRIAFRLYALHCNEVVDLHDVLRTKLLRFFLLLTGCKIAVIDKGRRAKKQLTARKNKRLTPLPSTFKRYQDVFARLGYTFEPNFASLFTEDMPYPSDLSAITGQKVGEKWLGIAPFAAHKGKMYPLVKMEEVLQLLHNHLSLRIFLFGGGPEEERILAEWDRKYMRVHSLAGKLRLGEELQVMRQLDLMLSMDSGNMHLASLVGTPVVSIWGATHPYAGFMGWNQDTERAIQKTLDCRPCSVYGNRPCYKGYYPCLTELSSKEIYMSLINELNRE